MNTNYDDEATQLQDKDNENTELSNSTAANSTAANDAAAEETPDEETCFEETIEEEVPEDEVPVKEVSKETVMKRAAVGAGTGLLIGGVATFLMGMQDPDKVTGQGEDEDNTNDIHPWVDDQIPVATTVTDDMSFNQAFTAAREEVGPGGCFEWHGQVYGTYTAAEWNAMTPEERAEYGSHFNWDNFDSSSSDVAPHTTGHTGGSHTATTTTTTTGGDDIEVVSVNHGENREGLAENGTAGEGYDVTDGGDVLVEVETEPEIEILGVVHDPSTGANIGGMLVDDQEVILVDVDGDLEFDFMGADINGNNQLDPDEVVDIQGQGVTVAQLGGFSDPMNDPTGGNMMASDDTNDYTADVYEG